MQMTDLTRAVSTAQTRALAVRPVVGGFPYLAEVLRQAGIRTVRCVVPSRTTTYVFAEGAVIDQANPQVDALAPVPAFDRDALIAAIRADQAGLTTYPTFMADIWNAGVVDYEIDLRRRTCSYHSTDGQAYVEHYPPVALPAAA
jgi:uncharacterized protein YbcV (DUF1398 family)